MNKIFQFLLILFISSYSGILNAQKNENHLEPVGGIYEIYDFQFEYYSKVRKVLFKGLTDSPEIRFQVMPSFTPENVLDIEYDAKNKKYYIIYHICEKMIWYNKDWENVKVNKFKSEIDKDFVELIKKLFGKAISKTRFSENDLLGFDGVQYYFSFRNSVTKSGTIWSPKKETNIGKLVEIGLELIELAKSKKVKMNKELQTKIEKLTTELK